MALKEPIVINNFQKGIAPSSYLGFEELRGLNITRKPGVCFANMSTAKASGTVVTEPIGGFAYVANNYYGFGISSSNFYKTTPNATFAAISGHSTGDISAIINYKDYIIIAIAGTKLDGYDGTTWDNNFITGGTTSGANGFLWATDDKLYISCGRYLDRLVENSGQNFDPASSATFTYTKNVLDLPEGSGIGCMVEMGGRLYLGGGNKIYSWDHYNTASSFDLPLTVEDGDINQMVVVNNLIYIQAGSRGNWYVSNGTSVQLFATMPDTLTNIGDSDGINVNTAINRYGIIYFGVSGGDDDTSCAGIWSLNTNNGTLNYEHLLSNYKDGNGIGNGISITAMYNVGEPEKFLIGYSIDSNDDFGVDTLSGYKYAVDTAYIISQFYRVATKYKPHTFQRVEVQLAKPIASPDSVSVWYRTAQNGSWTLIGTMNTVGQQSAVFPFAASVESIQFKISVNKEAELLEVTAI